MTAGRAVLVLALLAGAIFSARAVWRHIPPYETGIHEIAAEATATASRSDTPHIGDCPVLPADNIWNTSIETMPKDARSSAYIESIGGEKKMHPDFGSSLTTGYPYTLVPSTTTRVPIKFDYADDSDLARYPIPPDAPIEGGPSATGDRHVILIEPKRCLLRELFDAHPQPDGSWKAAAGVIIDLTSNALRGDGKTSADAAGLPIFPGLVRYDEVQEGAIRHALRFTLAKTQAAYVWPARHKASNKTDKNLPPMGTRFRLRADFDLSGFSKTNQIILTALKKYGAFLADNGSPMFFSGVDDKRWDNDDLHQLGRVTAADLEAVDESDLQMLGDSGRVDPLSVPRK